MADCDCNISTTVCLFLTEICEMFRQPRLLALPHPFILYLFEIYICSPNIYSVLFLTIVHFYILSQLQFLENPVHNYITINQ